LSNGFPVFLVLLSANVMCCTELMFLSWGTLLLQEETTWSWWIILSVCCWIQFTTDLRNFASLLIRNIAPMFSFCRVFIWFWYQGNIG
jgi:hypothetical protein